MHVLRSMLAEGNFGFSNRITLTKSLARPPGCAFMGANATAAKALLGKDATDYTNVIIDSGSDITLISHTTWQGLKNPPKSRSGQEVNLIQVTGKSTITGYIDLPILFQTDDSFVELNVEAYIVKGMNVPFILGNDLADQCSLSIIRKETNTFLDFGQTGRRVQVLNALSSPYVDDEGHTFRITFLVRTGEKRKKTHCSRSKKKRPREPLVRIHRDTTIAPETMLRVLIDVDFILGADYGYVEKLVQSRNGDQDFYLAPDSISTKDRPYLQLANFSNKPLSLRRGEVLGYLRNPDSWLDPAKTQGDTGSKLWAHTQAVRSIVKSMERPLDFPPEVENQEEILGGPKTGEVPEQDVVAKESLLDVVDIPAHLTPEQRSQLEAVLLKHERAFGLDGRLGTHNAQVMIPLRPGAKEVSLPPYTASPAKREAINKQMDSWLALEVVEPSKSAWGFPVLIVYQNGKPRMCVEYQKLNAVTIPDEYPLPKQSDIVQALQGSQWLSTLDALAGFTQIEIAEEDRPKTAFRTHKGLFQFRRMPFGLRNGPSFFQRVMQNVLAPYLWIFSLVYINDVVVYSPSFDNHLPHLDSVLRAIEDTSLTMSPNKCHFCYQPLLLLGQKVS